MNGGAYTYIDSDESDDDRDNASEGTSSGLQSNPWAPVINISSDSSDSGEIDIEVSSSTSLQRRADALIKSLRVRSLKSR